MTVRATRRGAERTSLDGERADVLVCGASFAGLAVARELAGAGADVLVVDRYDIGERATSACAAPVPWLRAMGVENTIRQELPAMTFSTPHGGARFELPWSWGAFDYRELCLALWEQCGAARFETATVAGREREPGGIHAVRTDRGTLRARIVVDALGWRRVLDFPHVQPPGAPLSRGLEVHPDAPGGAAGDSLDCWVDRSLARRGYAWRVPAGGEQRIGVGSYAPRDHVKEPTKELAARLGAPPVRFQGNWFPHALRPATADGIFFAGDSAGHCLPLSGEGIRTAFHFGMAAGREIRTVLAGGPLEGALARYGAFSDRHERIYARFGRLQRAVPALPPRALTVLFKLLSPRPVARRAFAWYLAQVPPPAGMAAS